MALESLFAPRGQFLKMLMIFSTLGALINFPEGYSNSYPNTSYQAFKEMINGSFVDRGLEHGISENIYTWTWSAILNVWFVGYLIGTFLTPYITETVGRKKSLLIANILALIGAVLSLFSVLWYLPELLFISRIIASCSSGISFGSIVLFYQEITPTKLRGFTSFMSEATFIMTTVVGVGFGMDALFGRNLPVLTGISIIPAVLSIVLILPMEETPKFLLIKKNDREAALRAVIFYHGKTAENEAVLDEIEKEKDGKPEISLWQSVSHVLREPHLRTAFFIGTLSMQTLVCYWPITYLSTDFLEANYSLEEAQLASFGFIIANFISSLVGMGVIERFGRRPMLLSLGLINIFSLCLYVFFDRMSVSHPSFSIGCVISLFLYGITYGIGLGPISLFITSELVNQNYRSVVQSMVFAVNTVVNCIVSFITLPVYKWINVWGFIPLFIIPSLFAMLYLFKNLPETKGREIHQIVSELQTRGQISINNNKMKSYQATEMESPLKINGLKAEVNGEGKKEILQERMTPSNSAVLREQAIPIPRGNI